MKKKIVSPYLLAPCSITVLMIAIFCELNDLGFILVLSTAIILLILSFRTMIHCGDKLNDWYVQKAIDEAKTQHEKIRPEINEVVNKYSHGHTIRDTICLHRFFRENGYIPSSESGYNDVVSKEYKKLGGNI